MLLSTKDKPYAILPLRDIVVFPHMIVPLFVGREKSVHALEAVMKEDKQILLVSQRSASDDDPTADDLYEIGTLGTILQMLKLPDGTVKVLVEGLQRVKISEYTKTDTYFEAYAELCEEEGLEEESEQEGEALMRTAVDQFEQYVRLNKKIPQEVTETLTKIDELSHLADTIASHLVLKIKDKQELLEMLNLRRRFEEIFSYMEAEIGVLEVEKKIRGRVKQQMEKTQRDYYLNEQMKAIQKELGDDEVDEIEELEQKLESLKLSKEAKQKADSELKKLKQMSPMSAEAGVVRNYLDWITALPWKKNSRVLKDLGKAELVLDADHYGLEKVKERILEYLAVQQRMNKIKGPILCLVGPPGVGKTSLGRSIAKATNRKFVRMSLGGVRDESEIRGHRRTYIGSMPGRIIQGMKKAKTSNPLFLLDEIDKLGSDWRGDPSSALLEVLDPEQNSTFSDHYMEIDYDLSNVMFVCTANSLNLPQPLLDRMEIIRLSGYTEDEKVEISNRHLIPKQFKENGIKKGELKITDDSIRDMIRFYTREAGVRSLEREFARIARKAVKSILMGKAEKVEVSPDNLKDLLGVQKFRFGKVEENDWVGVTTGLAWTEVGGDLLSIEAVTLPGKGKVSMTGKLGDVMKESIQAAEMLIKSRSANLGIDPVIFKKNDIHVHVPEGATPKDGPSAGCAMVTSIVSTLTGIAVRKDVAMTGEITLRGYVFPIGGLKEKLLAALRGGIVKVLIPKDNVKDLEDIPDNVKQDLEIIPVSTVDEVLAHALVAMPEPIEPHDGDDVGAVTDKTVENCEKDVIHH